MLKISVFFLASITALLIILQILDMAPVLTLGELALDIQSIIIVAMAFAIGLVIASIPTVQSRIAKLSNASSAIPGPSSSTDASSTDATSTEADGQIAKPRQTVTSQPAINKSYGADTVRQPVAKNLRHHTIEGVAVGGLCGGIASAVSNGVDAVVNNGVSPIARSAKDGCFGAYRGARSLLGSLWH